MPSQLQKRQPKKNSHMSMSLEERMRSIDTQIAHVWMVRAFLKHSEEAADDDELAEVHRQLYDYMLALGAPLKENNAADYLKLAQKKYTKLRQATENFAAIQPEISTHTNFQMALVSLQAAVKQIGSSLEATV
jgi:cob(I)alamin adenosyltransferase